jgi:hypothetical protein
MIPVAVPVAVVVPIALPPVAPAVIPIEIAVAAAEAAPLKPALPAQLLDFPPIVLRLAAEKAVAISVAVELALLSSETLKALVVPVARLSGPTGHKAHSQQQRSAQRCTQQGPSPICRFPNHGCLPATAAPEVQDRRPVALC